MAAGLAHDFNNLLAAVLGNAAIVRRSLDAESAVMSHARQIETITREAVDLANEMLLYSGRGTIDLKRFNLAQTIRRMKRVLEGMAPRGVKIRVQAEAGRLPIEGDEDLVRRAIVNLVENGCEALADRNGSVTVKVETVSLGPSDVQDFVLADHFVDGRYIRIQVSDTGCGMPRRIRDRMFEPFFSTKIRGRGMGLTTVLGAVRAHRGAVNVVTAPRKGATVTLLLPAAT